MANIKQGDFFSCTFEGDNTVYVAEVLTISPGVVSCRFVHSESRYKFAINTWTVLESSGAFKKGTRLTSQQIFAETSQPITINGFAAVTFSNGKAYLGKVIALEPLVVRFLHGGRPVYVIENEVIINSGGIYPKGQRIKKITGYQLLPGDPTTIINLGKKGLSYNGKEFESLASQIQGNILKSHGRNYTRQVFFKFNAGKLNEARQFIRSLADSEITSAKQQKLDAEKLTAELQLAKQESRNPNTESLQNIFINFFLSAKGYEFLQLDLAQFDPDFVAGMKSGNTLSSQLFDIPVENWDSAYQQEIHGMVLLAWSGLNTDQLNKATTRIKSQLQLNNLANIIIVEEGACLKNTEGENIEHFGFVDGISQPKFFIEEVSELKEHGVDTLNWDPLMPLDLVLVKDLHSSSVHAFGSYLVYRKLEQNIAKFNAAVINLSKTLFGSATTQNNELAGALLVGRFKNGMPLTLTKDNLSVNQKQVPKSLIPKMNDFDYSQDIQGARCPFHAHIRKTNPRKNEDDKRHMMARRGIPYGPKNAGSGAGLLFMSFQSNIFQQFQHQQEVFANSEDGGKDPIVGQGEISDGKQMCSKEFNNTNTIVPVGKIGDFVTLKGGEYFFAPSIDFLKSI